MPAIERGVERELYAVALTTGERTAILGVLDDPPDGGLCELPGRLLRDHQAKAWDLWLDRWSYRQIADELDVPDAPSVHRDAPRISGLAFDS